VTIVAATSTASPIAPLEGTNALVTGGGRGIGRAVALALAAAGADNVTVVSRTAPQLASVVSEIQALDGNADAQPCDVTDPSAVARLFDGREPFDVVVCSAGTNIPEPFVEVTPAHLDELFALNVKGTFFVLQEAARRLLDAGRPGVLIVVTSQMGHVGDPNRTAYCATKHALEGLVRALAVELGPHKIRVVGVAPTFVRTPMTEPFLSNDEFRAEVLRRIPLGRIGEPEDIAGAVVFLASAASRMITGASILIDGGWTAR
jgi:NAD(P)-dependent dehydrogenase (short-subunit alcohol dehydrogenase family)